jgi:hypothetical protein
MASDTRPSPILIIGSPRSGTTWLGQIYNSHPDTLYRHEPDIAQPTTDIPFIVNPPYSPEMVRTAGDYLETMINCRLLRAVGGRVNFTKSYRNPMGSFSRLATLRFAQIAEKISRADLGRKFAIPDYVDQTRQPECTVMKSVYADGRACLFSKAHPDLHIIHIVRHPCGQMASLFQGAELKLMPSATKPSTHDLAPTAQAKALG